MKGTRVDLSAACSHVAESTLRQVPPRPPEGCQECLATGGRWVHLRICLSCGHVGCCDSSPNKHATAHFRATQHPIVTSGEVGEEWAWCYAHQRAMQ